MTDRKPRLIADECYKHLLSGFLLFHFIGSEIYTGIYT